MVKMVTFMLIYILICFTIKTTNQNRIKTKKNIYHGNLESQQVPKVDVFVPHPALRETGGARYHFLVGKL